MKLASLDVTIVVLYLVVVLAIGFYFSRRQSGTADHFLAGRNLGWVVIGFSLFASNIASTTLVGLSGAAYQTGISISNYEWMASVVLVFFAWAGIFFGVASALIFAGSLVGPVRGSAAAFVWSPARVRQLTSDVPERPWYFDYRWQSVALLLLTAWLVIGYW